MTNEELILKAIKEICEARPFTSKCAEHLQNALDLLKEVEIIEVIDEGESELNSCPFESESLGPYLDDFYTADLQSYQVICDCGAMGPRSKTKEGAIKAWNKRCEQ
jgi:hypothetical protein